MRTIAAPDWLPNVSDGAERTWDGMAAPPMLPAAFQGSFPLAV
jgi:hypothetical protein